MVYLYRPCGIRKKWPYGIRTSLYFTELTFCFEDVKCCSSDWNIIKYLEKYFKSSFVFLSWIKDLKNHIRDHKISKFEKFLRYQGYHRAAHKSQMRQNALEKKNDLKRPLRVVREPYNCSDNLKKWQKFTFGIWKNIEVSPTA